MVARLVCVRVCLRSCAKRDNGAFSFWRRFSTFHLSSEGEAVMQSDTGKALFCYSDSTIKINRMGLFYNPCYSKRINMPVSCAKSRK